MEQQEFQTLEQSGQNLEMIMPNSSQPEPNQTSATSGAEHIDSLIAGFEEVEVKQEIEKRAASLMSKDEFKVLFFGAGNVCYVWLNYETLLTLNPNNPQAVEAIEALYDCIYDVPQLHWLLRPGNIWFQRAFSIGFFFIPFAIGIRKDVKYRRKLKIAEKKRAEIKEKEHVRIDLRDFDRMAS